MVLHSSRSLAMTAGFSPAELESLTRSVEQKKQRLEHDIHNYIKHKQEELCKYEQELIEEHRKLKGPTVKESRDTSEQRSPSPELTSPSIVTAEIILSDSATDSQDNGTSLRTKHNRVHKREKELCGLVTPLYLPLLEANNSPRTTTKQKEKRKQKDMKDNEGENSEPGSDRVSSQSPDKGRAKRRSKGESDHDKVEYGLNNGEAVQNDTSKSILDKKSKRPTIRKSSLKGSDSPRTRRKRVSIVIDDQIVLPADNIEEAALYSASETSASVTPDETHPSDHVIDPDLLMEIDESITQQEPTHNVRQEPVHHSLPYPIQPSSSPPRPGRGYPNNTMDPNLLPPPQTQTRTYLDPSPPQPDPIIPQNSSADPIYANHIETIEQEEAEDVIAGDDGSHDFHTYVGGMSGSGVDDVNQSGSYGYPSSLGASYLESYMKSRPLSVRLAAAERAGLKGEEKRDLVKGDGGVEDREGKIGHARGEDVHVHTRPRMVERDVDEDMDVIGSMDDF